MRGVSETVGCIFWAGDPFLQWTAFLEIHGMNNGEQFSGIEVWGEWQNLEYKFVNCTRNTSENEVKCWDRTCIFRAAVCTSGSSRSMSISSFASSLGFSSFSLVCSWQTKATTKVRKDGYTELTWRVQFTHTDSQHESIWCGLLMMYFFFSIPNVQKQMTPCFNNEDPEYFFQSSEKHKANLTSCLC